MGPDPGAVSTATAPAFPRPSARIEAVPAGPRLGWAAGAGWILCAAAVAAAAAGPLVGRRSLLGTLVAVIAVVASIPWFARVGRRFPDLEVAGLLRMSLGIKLLATLPRFEARQDSVDYHRVGAQLADSFRRFDFVVDTGRDVPGTGTVRYLTGLVEVVTFEDEFATFVVFSLFGFVALVWFVQAFHTALPGIDPRRYVLLVLFWPSLVYWPSSIGKEAVVLLGLAAAARGVGQLVTGRLTGLLVAATGLALCGMVRPHVALIAVTAAVCALIVRAPGRGAASAVVRVGLIGSLLFGGALASDAVERLFDIDGLSPTGVAAALDLVNTRSSQGGSSFAAARIDGLSEYPWGFVTVLFRPFPNEAATVPMLLTSLEAIVLAVLVVGAVPRVWGALRRVRDEAYVIYAASFTVVFVYLFSALGNFGILARQRTMVLPLVLALVALPTARERARSLRHRGDR